MKIALGADSYGFPLKESIKAHLQSRNIATQDFGVNSTAEVTPYYYTAHEVAKLVSQGALDKAILVCGTGMGMSIIANKHPGIFAAVCETTYAAEKSRSINNANILTLGSMITTAEVAKDIVEVWLQTEFTQGWDPSIQQWLHNSMGEIASIETQQFPQENA